MALEDTTLADTTLAEPTLAAPSVPPVLVRQQETKDAPQKESK